jgi:hypothetical protein
VETPRLGGGRDYNSNIPLPSTGHRVRRRLSRIVFTISSLAIRKWATGTPKQISPEGQL